MSASGAAALLIAILLCLVSCGPPDVERLPEGHFWAQRVSDGTWDVVETDPDLYREGLRCRVYVQEGWGDSVDAAAVEAIAEEFDNYVYPAVRSWFGETSDVDGDGRITILIMDIIDGRSPGDEYVAGYFHAVNEFASSAYRYSNERDMLYMDCKPGSPGAATFNLTMAHELQHLVNFNEKVFVQGSSGGQDTWINEGLSNAAEYAYLRQRGDLSPHVEEKVNYYNADPLDEIAAGRSFLSWSGQYENYVAAYLFFQWLRIHSLDGEGVYKRILHNRRNTYEAVVEETKADIADRVPDTRATDTDWEKTLRSWYIANVFYNPQGLYGYKEDLPAELAAPVHVRSGDPSPIPLSPGEAVFLDIRGASLDPSGNIAYAGLTAPAGVDLDSAYSGELLVAYNRNGNEEGAAETADAALSIAAPVSPARVKPRIAAADRAVDAVMGVGRTKSMVPRSLRR